MTVFAHGRSSASISSCGIPGETDLQEDARLAVYKLGEDANGELSPEPTRRGDLQDCVRAWSLV